MAFPPWLRAFWSNTPKENVPQPEVSATKPGRGPVRVPEGRALVLRPERRFSSPAVVSPKPEPHPYGSRALSESERAKLDQAYQMEKTRAGLQQTTNEGAMKFRKFVPPIRPKNFWSLPLEKRMWYCRMEELAKFRSEDQDESPVAGGDPLPGAPGRLPLRLPSPKAQDRKLLGDGAP